jgi:cytochrome c peroxidase
MSRRLFILIFSLGLMASYIDDSYILEYPEYFPEPTYNFDNNPLTISKIALGRALFYDPILSQDSTISCASCHSPYNAFAHTDHDLSHGINDEIGNRNASALFNLAWHESFMWDGAINHLDMQALAPISHAKEMGEDIKNVVRKLQNKAIYPPLFEAAFNDSIITGAKVLKALSQFQISLVSATSKYDEV